LKNIVAPENKEATAPLIFVMGVIALICIAVSRALSLAAVTHADAASCVTGILLKGIFILLFG